MNIEEIEITINTKGQVELHLRGIHGDRCLLVTKELEAVLGNEILIREMLAEYYDQTNQQQDNYLNTSNK